ncbi:condensation domain-containing protein, partial [Gilvimarinus sp. SDUM040013]
QAQSGSDSAVGLFINTLPLRVQLTDQTSIDWVKKLHDSLLSLVDYEHSSLAKIQQCSGVDAEAPLFSAVINYRHTGDAGLMLDAEKTGVSLLNAQERTNYPLSISVDDYGLNHFSFEIQVERDINAERVSEYMQQALQRLVGDLLDGGKTPVAELS